MNLGWIWFSFLNFDRCFAFTLVSKSIDTILSYLLFLFGSSTITKIITKPTTRKKNMNSKKKYLQMRKRKSWIRFKHNSCSIGQQSPWIWNDVCCLKTMNTKNFTHTVFLFFYLFLSRSHFFFSSMAIYSKLNVRSSLTIDNSRHGTHTRQNERTNEKHLTIFIENPESSVHKNQDEREKKNNDLHEIIKKKKTASANSNNKNNNLSELFLILYCKEKKKKEYTVAIADFRIDICIRRGRCRLWILEYEYEKKTSKEDISHYVFIQALIQPHSYRPTCISYRIYFIFFFSFLFECTTTSCRSIHNMFSEHEAIDCGRMGIYVFGETNLNLYDSGRRRQQRRRPR